MIAIPGDAIADGPTRSRGPCAECIASLPAGSDPRPLLVLLHGDGESATMMMGEWGRAAENRRIAVLALQCPRSEGCTAQSWWKWDQPVGGWLRSQVDAVRRMRPIDEHRMWVVGWSGGASYIGSRTLEFEPLFSAIVIHGGGQPPRAIDACSPTKSGVYFLVGDGNPLHALARELHDHYVRCQNDLVWTLLSHADHQGERAALASHREAILDWLETRSR
jgi:predicted esterase